MSDGRTADRFFRFGLEREATDDLARQSAESRARSFPHGVSVFSRSSRPDAASAFRADIEAHFVVHKTGRNRFHYTIELPDPVTDEVADLFNVLFGRPSR
jgi:hypothetical protein